MIDGTDHAQPAPSDAQRATRDAQPATRNAQRETRKRHGWLPTPLLIVFNCVRISLCAAWTAIVGAFILAIIWPRYWYGQVIFFVEGTRTLTGELQEFKKGAFHFAVGNHLPVLPTAIRGSFAALAKRPWWRMRPGNEIEVLFCPPIEASAGADYGEAVERLRIARISWSG